MYYVISPVPVDILKKYHIPFVGKTQTRDMAAFCATDDGKEFLTIAPLRICHERDKISAIAEAAVDIAWIGLCYNCPLYVSFMSDNAFYSDFDLGMARYTNFEKCTNMQREGRFAELPKEQQYFGGDFNTIVNTCEREFQFKIVGKEIVQYKLENNKIERV